VNSAQSSEEEVSHFVNPVSDLFSALSFYFMNHVQTTGSNVLGGRGKISVGLFEILLLIPFKWRS
jgi:hypothetical protein